MEFRSRHLTRAFGKVFAKAFSALAAITFASSSYNTVLAQNGFGVEPEFAYEMQNKEDPASKIFDIGTQLHLTAAQQDEYDFVVKVYESAAAKGSSEALLNLGYIYHKGVGVPVDYIAARDFYLKAISAGSKPARKNVNILYMYDLAPIPAYFIIKPQTQPRAPRLAPMREIPSEPAPHIENVAALEEANPLPITAVDAPSLERKLAETQVKPVQEMPIDLPAYDAAAYDYNVPVDSVEVEEASFTQPVAKQAALARAATQQLIVNNPVESLNPSSAMSSRFAKSLFAALMAGFIILLGLFVSNLVRKRSLKAGYEGEIEGLDSDMDMDFDSDYDDIQELDVVE